MRNMLAFLATAAITFAVLGWYLDWYKIQTTPGTAGRHNISIDIDSKKITEDVKKGVRKGEEKLHKVLDKESSEGSRADADKNPTPTLVIPGEK